MVEMESLNLLDGIEKVKADVSALPETFKASTQEVYERVRVAAESTDHQSRKSIIICTVILILLISVYSFIFVFSPSITRNAINETKWFVRRLEVANKTDCSLHEWAELCMHAVMDLDITNNAFVGLSIMGSSLSMEVHGRLALNQLMARHELGRAYLPEVYLPAHSTTQITLRQFWPIASLAVYSLLRDRVMNGIITDLEFDGYVNVRLLGVENRDIHIHHKRARLNITGLNLALPESLRGGT